MSQCGRRKDPFIFPEGDFFYPRQISRGRFHSAWLFLSAPCRRRSRHDLLFFSNHLHPWRRRQLQPIFKTVPSELWQTRSLVFLSQIRVEVGAKTFHLKFESVCRSLFSADNVKVGKVFVVFGPGADREAGRKEKDVPPKEELPA